LGEVGVDRSVSRRVVGPEPVADAGESLAWAQDLVGVGSMANLFTTDGVLLVVKREGGSLDAIHVQVIQRWVRTAVKVFADMEVYVLEAEGGRAGLASTGQVFCWAKEPEESDNAEVKEEARVTDAGEVEEDGAVDRVGSSGRVVLVVEGLEETNQ
jgi:hypothetical protein